MRRDAAAEAKTLPPHPSSNTVGSAGVGLK